jgi:hypothetical protein
MIITNSKLLEYEFDSQTISEFKTLQHLRLVLAQKQLEEVEFTIDELIKRNLLPKDCDRSKYISDLTIELQNKINSITDEMNKDDSAISSDDLKLYAKLFTT